LVDHRNGACGAVGAGDWRYDCRANLPQTVSAGIWDAPTSQRRGIGRLLFRAWGWVIGAAAGYGEFFTIAKGWPGEKHLRQSARFVHRIQKTAGGGAVSVRIAFEQVTGRRMRAATSDFQACRRVRARGRSRRDVAALRPVELYADARGGCAAYTQGNTSFCRSTRRIGADLKRRGSSYLFVRRRFESFLRNTEHHLFPEHAGPGCGRGGFDPRVRQHHPTGRTSRHFGFGPYQHAPGAASFS